MVINSSAELERALFTKMNQAMGSIIVDSFTHLNTETKGFYTGGTPKQYKRTGALGNTPRSRLLSANIHEIRANIYLDQSHSYTTGKQPSMAAVLMLADKGSYPGLRPTVGRQGFWERAEKKIEGTIEKTMRSFFH